MYWAQLRKIALLLSVFWVALSACSLTQVIPAWIENNTVLGDESLEAAVRTALEENMQALEQKESFEAAIRATLEENIRAAEEEESFEAAVRAALEENIRATEEEDIEAYLNTLHPDISKDIYAQTESTITILFNSYDIEYTIEIGDITLMDNGDARAEFVLTTRKLRGPAFRDNELTGVFYMRLDDGVWKFINQEISNIRYLN